MWFEWLVVLFLASYLMYYLFLVIILHVIGTALTMVLANFAQHEPIIYKKTKQKFNKVHMIKLLNNYAIV